MSKTPVKKSFNPIVIFLILIICILVGVSAFLYIKSTQITPKDSELESILKIISKTVDLPNEIPTLATVSDKNKLPKDLFYKNAENGDKVLIFIQAKKAILYRPTTKKVIHIVPVNNLGSVPSETLTQSPSKPAVQLSPQTTISPTPQIKVSIILLNGTNKTGATGPIEDLLLKTYNDVEIVDKDVAQKRDYEKTLIIDVNGKFTNQAQKISNLLHADIIKSTEEIATDEADILIIVGKDKL